MGVISYFGLHEQAIYALYLFLQDRKIVFILPDEQNKHILCI